MTAKEYLVEEKPQRYPTHPGTILKEDILPSLRISITEAAKDLGVSRQTLHRILNMSYSITPTMALRIGRFCNSNPSLWLRMQQAYDLKKAEMELGDELYKIPMHSFENISAEFSSNTF